MHSLPPLHGCFTNKLLPLPGSSKVQYFHFLDHKIVKRLYSAMDPVYVSRDYGHSSSIVQCPTLLQYNASNPWIPYGTMLKLVGSSKEQCLHFQDHLQYMPPLHGSSSVQCLYSLDHRWYNVSIHWILSSAMPPLSGRSKVKCSLSLDPLLYKYNAGFSVVHAPLS